MYGLSGFADKLKNQKCVNSKGNSVRNVWYCGEIVYSKFRKFSGILCTLYMCGMSGFVDELKIQNYVNSKGKCVH